MRGPRRTASEVFLSNAVLRRGQTLLAKGCFEDSLAAKFAAQSIPAGVDREAEREADIDAALVALYDTWHAAEPGKGHDAAAAQWTARLNTRTDPTPAQRNHAP